MTEEQQQQKQRADDWLRDARAAVEAAGLEWKRPFYSQVPGDDGAGCWCLEWSHAGRKVSVYEEREPERLEWFTIEGFPEAPRTAAGVLDTWDRFLERWRWLQR